MTKLDLFKDRTVWYTYEAGKCVTLWVSGFKVVVYKPYACETGIHSQRVYTEPKIAISTNATIRFGYRDFKLIDKAIQAAVQILNNEGFGIIDIQNWKSSDDEVLKLESPYYNMQVETKSVTKSFVPLPGDVFVDTNNNTWLYIGNGILYEFGNSKNGIECNNIYIPLNTSNYFIEKQGACMKVVLGDKYYSGIDTYKTKKRGVKLLARHGNEDAIAILNIYTLLNNSIHTYTIRPLEK